MIRWFGVLLLVLTMTALAQDIGEVEEGTEFYITARIWNSGNRTNHATIVYYDNSMKNEAIIGYDEVDFTPKNYTWTSLLWNASGVGVHKIYISIENPFLDASKENNIASREILVTCKEKDAQPTTTTTTLAPKEPEPTTTTATFGGGGGVEATTTTSTTTTSSTTTTLGEDLIEIDVEPTTTTLKKKRVRVVGNDWANYIILSIMTIITYFYIRKKRKEEEEYED